MGYVQSEKHHFLYPLKGSFTFVQCRQLTRRFYRYHFRSFPISYTGALFFFFPHLTYEKMCKQISSDFPCTTRSFCEYIISAFCQDGWWSLSWLRWCFGRPWNGMRQPCGWNCEWRSKWRKMNAKALHWANIYCLQGTWGNAVKWVVESGRREKERRVELLPTPLETVWVLCILYSVEGSCIKVQIGQQHDLIYVLNGLL